MRPISMLGMLAVVRAGVTTSDSGEPSKPVTITSSGIERPMFFTAVISFKAMKSLAQKNASGSLGLAFDYSGKSDKYKLISLDPNGDTISLSFNEGSTPITETTAVLDTNQTYSFTYLQEGSVGVFYVDGVAGLTVRLYGVSGKPVCLFAENNSVTFSDLTEHTN